MMQMLNKHYIFLYLALQTKSTNNKKFIDIVKLLITYYIAKL